MTQAMFEGAWAASTSIYAAMLAGIVFLSAYCAGMFDSLIGLLALPDDELLD